MSKHEPNINWSYSGVPNPMVGTGATRAEEALVWVSGLAGIALMVFLSGDGWVAWTWWQTAIAAIVAFDVLGGVVANQLNAAKRFYHAPLKPEERGFVGWLKEPLFFTTLHVHPLVIYLLWRPDEFLIGFCIYAALVGANLVIHFTPLYLVRPVASLFVLAALIASAFAFRPIPGFEWLVPALAIKLLLGHATREEPYRPANDRPSAPPADDL